MLLYKYKERERHAVVTARTGWGWFTRMAAVVSPAFREGSFEQSDLASGLDRGRSFWPQGQLRSDAMAVRPEGRRRRSIHRAVAMDAGHMISSANWGRPAQGGSSRR
jgi:hypothetical protein